MHEQPFYDPVKHVIAKKERTAFILVALVLVTFTLFLATSRYFEHYYEQQIEIQHNQERLIEIIKFRFKVQVQEWKNVLLRGANRQDFIQYYSAFTEEHKEVQSLTIELANVTRSLPDVHRQANAFLNAHSLLFEKYNSALDRFDETDDKSVFAVDFVVRGIDRAPTLSLMKLEHTVIQAVDERIERLTHYKHVVELILALFLTCIILLLLKHLFSQAKKSTRNFYAHGVTGIYNKNALLLSFQHLIDKQSPVTLMLADIDNFKTVNEVKGVAGADKLLKEVVSYFMSNDDIRVFHISSNLFFVIPLDQSLSPSELETQMQARFKHFRSQWSTKSQRLSFTTCVGALDTANTSADDLFNRCSAAMQEAKACGKGLAHHYDNLKERIDNRQSLMRSALSIEQLVNENKLVLYGQAIVPNQLEYGASKYEVLLRVDKNSRHTSPYMVLAAAEKYDKSVQIDKFVISQVIQELKMAETPFFCSINVSAQSLNHQSFIDFLIDKVNSNKELNSFITFELTETAIIGNLNVAKTLFETLRALGCKIAIDDFGVGESSLRYLLELSVDIVKIDGFFIKQLETSSKARKLVDAIISICHSLNIKTVAEFVENENLRKIVTQMGITYSQGYGIHLPQPLTEILNGPGIDHFRSIETNENKAVVRRLF